LPLDFKIDKDLKAAIDIYKQHTITTSYILLQRTKSAADKVGKFLEDVDLYAEDEKGKPKYQVQ